MIVRSGSVLIFSLCALLASASCTRGTNRSQVSINGVSYSISRTGEQAERLESGDLPAGLTAVSIENYLGPIDVIESDRAGWDWKATCWADELSVAEEVCQELRLEETYEGGVHTIRLILPTEQRFNAVSSELTVRLPAHLPLRVTSQFGRVRVEDRGADLAIDASFSPLEIRNVTGEVVAKTSFGEVEIREVGRLEITNRHGDISIQRVSGDLIADNRFGKVHAEDVEGSAKIQTAHASLRLDGVEGPVEVENQFGSVRVEGMSSSVIAECEHGAVDLELHNPQLERVEAQTSFAAISVSLNSQVDPAVRTSTSFGKVSSQYPTLTAGSVFPDTHAGKPRVDLKTKHGNIKVRRMP